MPERHRPSDTNNQFDGRRELVRIGLLADAFPTGHALVEGNMRNFAIGIVGGVAILLGDLTYRVFERRRRNRQNSQ
jgi:hypothetical protein